MGRANQNKIAHCSPAENSSHNLINCMHKHIQRRPTTKHYSKKKVYLLGCLCAEKIGHGICVRVYICISERSLFLKQTLNLFTSANVYICLIKENCRKYANIKIEKLESPTYFLSQWHTTAQCCR